MTQMFIFSLIRSKNTLIYYGSSKSLKISKTCNIPRKNIAKIFVEHIFELYIRHFNNTEIPMNKKDKDTNKNLR